MTPRRNTQKIFKLFAGGASFVRSLKLGQRMVAGIKQIVKPDRIGFDQFQFAVDQGARIKELESTEQ